MDLFKKKDNFSCMDVNESNITEVPEELQSGVEIGDKVCSVPGEKCFVSLRKLGEKDVSGKDIYMPVEKFGDQVKVADLLKKLQDKI